MLTNADANDPILLFDLAESLILKELLHLVELDRPYDDIASVVAGCAGLYVADDSPELCLALLNMPPPRHESHYVHDLPTTMAFYAELTATLPELLLSWQDALVDGYILSHEASHLFLKRPTAVFSRLERRAAEAFDFALEQVCYEQQPNFKEIAQNYGQVPLPDDELEHIRRDLINRRQFYMSERARLTEEIACDAHGLLTTGIGLSSVWKTGAVQVEELVEGYTRFAYTYFLLFVVADLHQAMVERARHSITSGVLSEKPGAFAEKHLRKIALLFAMADQALMYLPEPARNQAEFQKLIVWFVEKVGAWKRCIDALVVMPVTRLVVEQIEWFENEMANGCISPADPSCWRECDLGHCSVARVSARHFLSLQQAHSTDHFEEPRLPSSAIAPLLPMPAPDKIYDVRASVMATENLPFVHGHDRQKFVGNTAIVQSSPVARRLPYL